ncbi:MAG: peptidylprolyl isomerase [Rhodoferax sp.]|nr:peptidylprolyl isomerase [Rhodoferax sp.]MDP3652639.1 peptidylprolyl isomerase [Rhodoferax sp.]
MRLQQYAMAGLGLSGALLLGVAWAAQKDVPTVYRDNAETRDSFVQRAEPDLHHTKLFKLGQLGVLVPSYGREPLFLAYRAMVLGRAGVEKQAADTPRPVSESEDITGGMAVWLDARATVIQTPPAQALVQEHNFGGQAYGSYLNCGNAAFNFAAETLQTLKTNKKVDKPALEAWVAAQDTVFALCGNEGTDAGVPRTIPAELGAGTPLYLRQLRQYQVAAAYFYAENYSEAVRRFDEIAAIKVHPLRAWASHAAMRALLRSASLDRSFMQRIGAIKNSSEPPANKVVAMDSANTENQRNMQRVFDQIAARSKAILADKTLANIHLPANRLVKQAALMIVPNQVYSELSAALGRFDKDVDSSGELDDWRILGDQLFDWGWNADLIAQLRGQYAYFDWIRTVQGCTDNPRSPNFSGRCEQENIHALELWKSSRSRAWLVATLMTARSLTPPIEEALEAAQQVNSQEMEYLTLRYYMARLLRQAGRYEPARVLVEQVLSGAGRQIPRELLKNTASANSLFQQEGLALAKNDAQAVPFLLRDAARRLGADGDELLNRRLSSEDLLRWAQIPGVDANLRHQLLVASWWRADLVENAPVAEKAARHVADLQSNLRDAATSYLKINDVQERHYFLARMALAYRISPQVFLISKDFAGRRKPGAADFWCSFASEDFKTQARLQRVPVDTRELSMNPAARDKELAKLRSLGSGADWMARVALGRAKTQAMDATLQAMLDAVVKSEALNCTSAEADSLVQAAKQALANVPANNGRVVTEAEVRAVYEKYKSGNAGKTEYHASHILLKSESEALAALGSIQSGTSFEETARKQSIDGSSAKNGGDLGWQLAETYVKPFENALRSLGAPGLLPQPVKTPFGWHVIRVQGMRPFALPGFEEVRASIEKELRKQPK